MKAKCIHTKLIESNESEVHSNKAIWFKQSLLNEMKAKCIQTKLIESNESQVHSNKANWIKWKSSTFKQS